MSASNYLSGGVVGAILGIFAGLYIAGHADNKPDLVYVKELNGDSRFDVVVKATNKNEFIYLQQEDGSCKELSEFVKEEGSKLIKSIETKLEETP